jgi:ABC-type Co2+ transport system permease subunit
MIHQKSVAESILEVTAILSSAAVSWIVSALVIKRDEKRLDEEMLLRAYPRATFAVSIFLFQQLAILVHFIRTRRSFKGFLLGIAWTIAAFVPTIIVDTIFGFFVPD